MTQDLQEQVKQALTEQSFREATILQLEKDFHRCGLDLKANEQTDLLQTIQSCISGIANTQLQQLIYLIDIPEQFFLSLAGKEHFQQEISEVILMREALKVYLRKKFSEI